jgi:hypothetical protein
VGYSENAGEQSTDGNHGIDAKLRPVWPGIFGYGRPTADFAGMVSPVLPTALAPSAVFDLPHVHSKARPSCSDLAALRQQI